MKRYNVSDIMKSAWRTYRLRKGAMSFSDCLKRAWKIAKMDAITSECIEEGNKRFADSMKEFADSSVKAKPCSKYNNVDIPASAYYSGNKGYMGANFCND